MADQTFERTLPHLNVGTLGHEGHGKTMLTSAITHVLASEGRAVYRPIDDLDKSPDERKLMRTLTTSHVEYITDARHYAHIDCPGHHAYGRNVYTGVAQLDGAILVVSGREGLGAQTREHILLARQAGIGHLVVFMSKHDHDSNGESVIGQDQAEDVEQEVRAMLESYDYPGDIIPFIRGSAQDALRDDAAGVQSIQRLLKKMDETFPVPERKIDLPFLMPIADALLISGQGTVVTGSVRQGVVKVGDEVELVGLTDSYSTVVTGVETFNKTMFQAQDGDHVGLKLRGVKREDIHRGQVLVMPSTVRPRTKVVVGVYFLARDEGGRHTPFFEGYRPQIHVHTADVPCTVRFAEGTEMMMPGDYAELTLEFMKPLYVEKGDRFALRDGGRTIGVGIIGSIIV